MPSPPNHRRWCFVVAGTLTIFTAVIHGTYPQFGTWSSSGQPVGTVQVVERDSTVKPTKSEKPAKSKKTTKPPKGLRTTAPTTSQTTTPTTTTPTTTPTTSPTSLSTFENNTSSDDENYEYVKDHFLFGSVQYAQAKNQPPDVRDLKIPYFCDGPIYQEFAQAMRDFAQKEIDKGRHPPTWGKREMPPNSKVLIFGNSHTRQIGVQLAMQHELPLPYTEIFDQHISGKMARRFDLGHNRSVFVVANSYVAFSKDWKIFLERQIQFKLEDLDAIVVSVWNSCTSYVMTTFQKEMLALSEELEGVDCAHIPGPTVTDIAKVYDGPLAFVSMFAKYRDDDIAVAKAEVEELQKTRPRLDYLDARRHIKEMDMECGAAKKTDYTPDCDHSEEAGQKYHRCVGPLGGHPDMIAWDVSEFVWKYTQPDDN